MEMDSEKAAAWAESLKAVAHPTRLQIIGELLAGTRCVTDIQDLLPVSQSNISQHLAVLRHARLVDFVQEGAQRCYYLSRPGLAKGLMALLAENEPILRKSREEINREQQQTGVSCKITCGSG
jgi:DNA-binding transcriptional ArsR family regulator